MNLTEFQRTTRLVSGANDELNRPIIAKQDDVSGRTLRIQITDGGTVKDLSDATVFLCWVHESLKWKGIEPFVPVTPTEGIFELAYPTHMLHPGTLKAYISICYYSRIINTINFNIYVQDDLGIQDALEDEDQFFASLKQQLVEFEDTLDGYQEALEDGLTQFTNQIQQQQTQFTQQMQQQAAQFSTQLNQQDTQFKELMDSVEELTGVVPLTTGEIDTILGGGTVEEETDGGEG